MLWCVSSAQAATPHLESLMVKAPDTDKLIAFNITLPPSYDKNPDKHYVLLFDFHPRSRAYLDGMHDWMSHNGDWPWLETIIVTAPDGDASLGKLKRLAIEELGNTALLDFMQQSLLPAIDAKYRTNGFRIMNGFTGNAGLVLYTLLNRPELFNAYLAASPVLSDDFAYVMKSASKKLASLKGKPRYLMLTTSDSGFEQRQLADFAALEQLIKTTPNPVLHYQVKRFDGTYYMTQPILATAYGIEWLFDDYHRVLTPDSEIARDGVAAILAHYRYLSEQKYGFNVPSTDSLIALADAEFAKDGDKGLAIYLAAVEANPESHTAHNALARAYGKLKMFDLAITQQKLALAKTKHPFWTRKYNESLAELEAQKLE
nr:alpha/beta hydrolase-fold protein [Shewanella sp. Isolate11]